MSAADRAIRASTTAAVLGVAGVAAYVSYWHAYEVVRAHGETGVTARLEPATIDGLVYCSSMVVLYAARHQLRVPALARWLLGLGIMATLATWTSQPWPPTEPVSTAVPLSERKLAAMFGKTSRRWARNRMAEARCTPASAVSDLA